MYIKMQAGVTEDQIREVCNEVTRAGFTPRQIQGEERVVIACVGGIDSEKAERLGHFRTLTGVDDAQLISPPFKLSARQVHPEPLTVPINSVAIGAKKVVMIAGPCSVESLQQILDVAQFLKNVGADALRGGAFKPRTSPHGFQGLGEVALEYLAEARELTGLPVVTEAMAPEQVSLVAKYADVIQVGARNMQNYPLLSAVGASGKPCLLKRHFSATIDEWLSAAEYILTEGNNQVVLCARGIRSFDSRYSRNSSDIDATPLVKDLSYLPVVFDPSHAAGRTKFVSAVALGAIAAGADGLIVEVHPDPRTALTDADQQLNFAAFGNLMVRARKVAEAVGRSM